jgi:predicted RNase H-like HicB family nuclease
MTVADYLRVPYLLQSTAVEGDDGQGICQVSYPELPGCVARAPTLLAALDELDRRRIRVIIDLLREGRRPPTPRGPLRDRSPGLELDRLGLAQLADMVDVDEHDLASMMPSDDGR